MELYIKVMTYLFAFIIGACIGSAALCFFDRRKRGEPWTKGHSHCTACGHELKTKDLIPVFSYLSLHGKCRYCHTPYPMATFLSEVSSGLAFMFAAGSVQRGLAAGNALMGGLEAVLFVMLALAAANDICCHECEYVLQFGILAVGIAIALLFGSAIRLLIGGWVCVMLILVDFLYRKFAKRTENAIGFADIIVFTGVTCALPPLAAPLMLFCSCVFSILSVPLAKKNQKMQKTEEDAEGVGMIPFILFGMFAASTIYRMYLVTLFI